ncbi:hypothetical protein BDP67DRAFT_497214 [Colletotrichum lupini]|nr:hypothetical protein BDP67DRAFT_497214 [Colletotrichum lupini]
MAALSWLAKQMQSLRPPEDRYLVGLWEKTLLSDLLWTQGWSYTAPNSRISRYPSWSWASSPYQVEWSRDLNIPLKCTQVEATKVTTRGPSHMADCIEATITLKAPLLDATPLLTATQAHIAASRVSGDYESSSPFGHLYPDPYDAFITNLDHLYVHYYSSDSGSYITDITPAETSGCFILLATSNRSLLDLNAIHVQKEQSSDCYRRVGLASLRHPAARNKYLKNASTLLVIKCLHVVRYFLVLNICLLFQYRVTRNA